MYSRGAKWDYRPGFECDWCGKKTWTEKRANNKRQCRGCKVCVFFKNVLYAPLGFDLPEWSESILYSLYGNIDEQTGFRIFRRAYISMGKQSGKTNLVSGLPIYHILGEDELNPEVVGAASAKDQAEIAFRSSCRMIDANPLLSQKLRVIPSTRRILERESNGSNGIYKVISSDGDIQDGQRPSLFIMDELHRWKTLRHQSARDILTKGQISRDEPLTVAITTAGAEYESQLWFSEYQLAKRVLQDQSIAPDYFVAIWEADRKRLENDPEYWKSREARAAANPSHEDHGGHIRDAALVSELNKAIEDPSQKSSYIRFHLNIPTTQTEDPIIEMSRWQENADPLQKEYDKIDQTSLSVDLREWPSLDKDAMKLLISRWGLIEEPCFCGVDASWTTDLTAVVFVFPPTAKNEIWTFLPFFWCPEKRIRELERTTRMPIASWVERGFIHAPPGDGIDLQAVKDRILWGNEMFTLLELDFDRANFRTQAMELGSENGIITAEVKQHFMELSAATKYLLAGYMDRKFRHGNHPVLNWMAGCLQLQYDRKDLVQPSKPERGKSAKRIDGISAIVTAFARALTVPKPRKSIYVTRGIQTLPR